MPHCNSESCSPPSCCLNGNCVNSTDCSTTLCGKIICSSDCCKENVCLLKMECFIQRNKFYFYGLLVFLFVVFMIFGYRWKKRLNYSLAMAKKRKKKKIIMSENAVFGKKIEIENPKIEIKEELKNITEPFQPNNELIITEREEFINSAGGSYVSNSKEFACFSTEKKNLQQYTIRNRKGSTLRVNLRALSQTTSKIVRLVGFRTEGKKRNKTIHIGQAYNATLDTNLAHQKYRSFAESGHIDKTP